MIGPIADNTTVHDSVRQGYTIRAMRYEGARTICRHRRAMFFDMGHRDTGALDAMSKHFLPWVQRRIQEGDYLGWFAIAPDGSVAAGLGLWLMDWPPHMLGPAARRGNIINVYTEHPHRRQGLARTLMARALDWSRENGIRSVILHASQEGRGLYESFGFRASNEMRLVLDE
jgi:GNAT superfamily N-acetyltransferase